MESLPGTAPSSRKSTLDTSTLSLAVAATLTTEDTVAPWAGVTIEADGFCVSGAGTW